MVYFDFFFLVSEQKGATKNENNEKVKGGNPVIASLFFVPSAFFFAQFRKIGLLASSGALSPCVYGQILRNP